MKIRAKNILISFFVLLLTVFVGMMGGNFNQQAQQQQVKLQIICFTLTKFFLLNEKCYNFTANTRIGNADSSIASAATATRQSIFTSIATILTGRLENRLTSDVNILI